MRGRADEEGSYAKGYAAEWDAFLHQIGALARAVPYMTALGNHERDWPSSGANVGQYDSGGECGVPYAHRFPMPPPTPSPTPLAEIVKGSGKAGRRVVADEPWYSFDEGLVHVAVLSSEHNAQVTWLERDLQAVRRDVTPWVIVVLHRPMYVTGVDGTAWHRGDDYRVAAKLRAAYEQVMRRYQVDLVLAGHHHSYQRTCPIFNNTCAPHAEARPQAPTRGAGGAEGYWGPVHVVVGMGGYANTPILVQPPHQFVFTDSLNHGFTRISARPQALTFEFLVPLSAGKVGEGESKRRESKSRLAGLRIVDACVLLDSFVLSH